MTLIAVGDIAVEFGATTLFERISFTVGAGERWGIIGRNGSGKTTLFKLLTRQQQPTRGSIAWTGDVRVSLLEQHRDFGGATTVWEAAAGPFAEQLRALSPEELSGMAAWVSTGTSSYTVGATDGLGFPGHEQLRALGAGSLVVLPLRSAAARRSMLIVTTPEVLQLRTDDVQLLELFAGTVTTSLQIADNVQALRQRANADALTGLGHHATFHATLKPVRERSGPDRLAVLYIDVDHFKSVNDKEGHAAGDQLLILLAECMQAALRDDDLLFRIGGDEFAALAHVTTDEQALALGERLLAAVHERSSVSLSVGVAVEVPGESDTALLARADAAVYAAKAAGRGVVRLSPPSRSTMPDPRGGSAAAGRGRG